MLNGCTPPQRSPEVRATWFPQLDSAIRPQDDFYRFINNSWLKKPDLVPGDVRGSPALQRQHEVQSVLLQQLLAIETDGRFPEGTDPRKALNFFTWASDSVAALQGLRAIQPWLRQIQAIKTETDFLRVLRRLQTAQVPVFFEIEAISGRVMSVLPLSREVRHSLYTWSLDNKRVRAQVIQAALERAGVPRAESHRKAVEIDGLENALDNAYEKPALEWPPQRMSETVRTTRVSWGSYFTLAADDTLLIARPAYWQVVNQFIAAATNLERKKDFLTWRVLAASAPFLGPAWLPVVYGDRKMTWRGHCLVVTQRVFPDVFGRLFVRGSAGLGEEGRIEEIAGNVRLALAAKIKETNRWPDSVKRGLLATLATNRTAVLPQRPYASYQTLQTGRGGAGSWAARMLVLLAQKQIHNPADPVMRGQPFSTEVQWVSNNRIFVPLALLQPPFLTDNAAWNYGALGVAISRLLLAKVSGTSDALSSLDVNIVAVAYQGWQRFKMESGQMGADDFPFFAAVAYHHREVNVADPAVGAERAAEVFDALSSFPPFYQWLSVTSQDKMFRGEKYRAVIW